VQSQIGNNMWQVDPYFKVQFLLLVRVLLYDFHEGYLNLTLVHALTGIFVREIYYDFLERNKVVDILSHLC
jgi:hypothetical protein